MIPLRSYWADSRSPRYSLLFALPLLVVYELLAALLAPAAGGVRNGADVLLRSAFALVAGRWAPVALGAVVVGAALGLVVRDLRGRGGLRAAVRPRIFLVMLAESAALALVFGAVVAAVTSALLHPTLVLAQGAEPAPLATFSWPQRLMLSVGAGLYEELLFRVVLVSGLMLLAHHVAGLSQRAAGAVAVVAGAALFSAAHYVGAYGDPFTLESFTFRFVAGLFFSALYVLRGFGITAWTHALYDAFLLVL
ncbi:MAG TPA: CPBP family glutamic-type intramembrane protease [Gemmatimonadaceae bacterium]|nr:CPBP family glutamic-type intramembrane protease [Gemmatimonadaceae bacterium]